jgi:hypothetical protein
MPDIVKIFLGELKCTLQRFEPKPGDVFVLTIPEDGISGELAEHLKSGWEKGFPNTKCVVITGGMTVELAKRRGLKV